MRNLLLPLVALAYSLGCSGSSSTPDAGANDASVTADGGSDGAIAPDATSDAGGGAAATTTASTNALCTAVAPFYWEIGDQSGAIVSGSVGTDTSNNPIVRTTKMSIASASKWLYGMYVVQIRGAASKLTSADQDFLHFTSGYTNMGSDTKTSECPSTDNPDTVNTCLALVNTANNEPYSYKDPATVGKFDYDSGHLENHASQLGGIGDVLDGNLGDTIGKALGPTVTLLYTEPLIAGGVYTTAGDYATVLQRIVGGELAMHDALGIAPVCTAHSSSCNAVLSPIPEAWHYSMAHWVEDDATTGGDGAFSSAGAFGFYPWVEAGKTYYGVLARQVPTQAGHQNGYESAQCGRLIRRAFDTGVVQTGTLPM